MYIDIYIYIYMCIKKKTNGCMLTATKLYIIFQSIDIYMETLLRNIPSIKVVDLFSLTK